MSSLTSYGIDIEPKQFEGSFDEILEQVRNYLLEMEASAPKGELKRRVLQCRPILTIFNPQSEETSDQ